MKPIVRSDSINELENKNDTENEENCSSTNSRKNVKFLILTYQFLLSLDSYNTNILKQNHCVLY